MRSWSTRHTMVNPSVDWQARYVLGLIRSAGNPEYWQMTPAQARDWHNRKSGLLDVRPPVVFRVDDRAIAGPADDIALRIYTPRKPPRPFPALVWLHGG